MTVVVAHSHAGARRLAAGHRLAEDAWVHAATAAVATDWIDRADERGVGLDWLAEQRPARPVSARTIVVARPPHERRRVA